MINDIDLRAEATDALTEIFNIGVGRAASVLSDLVQDEVLLTVPQVRMMRSTAFVDMAERLWQDPSSIVRQSFGGPFNGDALLIYPVKESLDLVRYLLANPTPIDTMTELEREALLEVGNIILNACLSCVADMLETEITNALPLFVESKAGQLIKSLSSNTECYILFLSINFRVQKHQLTGNIIFVLDIPAADTFSELAQRLAAQFSVAS